MCTNLIWGVVIVFAVCQKIADNNAMWADEDDEVVQFAKLRRTSIQLCIVFIGLLGCQILLSCTYYLLMSVPNKNVCLRQYK